MKKAASTGGSRHAIRGATAGKKTSTVTSRKGRGACTNKVKKQSVVPARAGEVQDKKGKVSPWTKEDEMARKIQSCYRGYRCRILLFDLKKKKTEYDQLMEKLQKEAYVQMVKLEQQRAEAQRKREGEERKRRKEHAKRVTRMLEAAFDGDTIEIRSILEEVRQLCCDQGEEIITRSQYMLVECTDANKNTPLSEAAAGGDEDTICLLLTLEANPNSKGQYGRTPLYRAAFAGHHKAVKILLESGADPRLTAEDGERPEQVASNSEVECVFKDWKLEDTERLLQRLQEAHKNRMETHDELFKAIGSRLKDAEKECVIKQRELMKAHEELNKRICEHDKNMATGTVKIDITLAVVHDAEDHLESVKLAAEAARKKLSEARLQLRLKRKEFENDDESVESPDDSSDVTINILELDDVLMKDVGKRIADSGKWPLIIDPGRQAATFLRYRDTNYINCCNPGQMDPDTLRIALLGAIKYGKFLVLDMLDVDGLWAGVEQQMNLVQKDLFKDLLDTSLIKENKFQFLTRESDGDEYSAKMLLSARANDFKLVVLTQLVSLPKEFTEKFYVIRIHISNPK